MSYESYNAYLSIMQSAPYDNYKDDFQELINREYENATTLKTVMHNGQSIIVRVVGKFNSESLSRQNESYQKIIFRTPDYIIKVGDIFEFDNAKWICTDVSSTVVSKSCTVTKANNEINIYKNTILYKSPVIVEDAIRLYNMGVDNNKYITEPNTTIIARTPNNEITSLITRNDIYKLGKDNYKVVDISDIIQPGLLILKLEYIPEKQIIKEQSDYVISGDPEIRVGSTKTYKAIRYVDGTIDTTAQFDFSVVDTGVPNTAYTLTILNDAEVSIKCNDYVYYLTLRATYRLDNTKYAELKIRLANLF